MTPIRNIISNLFKRFLTARNVQDYDGAYDDVPIKYIKAKKKYWEYIFDHKTTIDGNVYLCFISRDDSWFLWGDILVFDGESGTEIGRASYGLPKEDSPLKAAVDVRKDMRRKGVASNIYIWIESLTGKKLHPDLPHSKDAELFWANPNRRFGFDK